MRLPFRVRLPHVAPDATPKTQWRRAALFCLVLSAALTHCSLLLGAASHTEPLGRIFLSCLRRPAVFTLNLLPPLLLMTLGLLVTRRLWAAYLFAAVPTFALSLANLYKSALRGEPLVFSDLRIARTAFGILSRYRLPFRWVVVFTVLISLALLAASLTLPPLPEWRGRARAAALLAWLTIVPVMLTPCYLSDASYAATENEVCVLEDSDGERYALRGVWYSFLHTVPDVFSPVPADYAARRGAERIARYTDADIPAGQRVQVVSVMLEAFCDLTDYPMLASLPGVAAVYEPLHALERRAISGNLITNVFGGGTVDTEWGYLTGLSHHGDFTEPLDSYVRYFASQGYDTIFQHPGYSWFYDRRAVNENLGFSKSVFTEDGFGELVDPRLAPYRSDAILFDYLLGALDAHGDAPLFSFAVSYQNHGPYGDALFDGAAVTPAETGWSAETCGILSHYLYGLEDTVRALCRFTDELEQREEPVVLVIFGDHKPWLGNDRAVYQELGVNAALNTEDGFRNIYATPYLIWANTAAKRVLNRPFIGESGDLSPCLLMEELFDCCGWEGGAFLQLQREMRARSSVMHTRGVFLVDGAFLSKSKLPKDILQFYLDYRNVEAWRKKYSLTKFSTAQSAHANYAVLP